MSRLVSRALFGAVPLVLVFGAIVEASAQVLPTPGVDPRAARCVKPPSGMISWWPFDRVAVGTAKDIIGSNDGDLLGPLLAPGWVGNALQFDGVDDYVIVAPAPNLELTSMTLEAWVYPDSLRVARIFSKLLDQQYLLQLDETAGAIEFTIFWPPGSLTKLRSAAWTVTVGEWQHIAGTYDGAAMKIYYSGELVAEVAESREPASHGTPLAIGTWYSGVEAFEGLIDEPAIYGRALSASEIQAIYLARGGKCKVTPAWN